MFSRHIAIAAVFVLVAVAVAAPVASALAEDSLRTSGTFFDVRTGEYVLINGKTAAHDPWRSTTK